MCKKSYTMYKKNYVQLIMIKTAATVRAPSPSWSVHLIVRGEIKKVPLDEENNQI